MNREEIKRQLDEKQQIVNQLYETDGLTDEVLNMQVDINAMRHEYDLVDETELINLPDNKNNVENEVQSKLQAFAIQKVLHEIDEPYREVFMWRDYADLSFKEIAGIFNKNENWACVTYHRARKLIKERLESEKI